VIRMGGQASKNPTLATLSLPKKFAFNYQNDGQKGAALIDGNTTTMVGEFSFVFKCKDQSRGLVIRRRRIGVWEWEGGLGGR